MPQKSYVYVLASRRNGTLYIGVTSDLLRRVWAHRHNLVEGFTQRYCVHLLVYFEAFDDIRDAISREKQLKKWNRAWKLRLIEGANPTWRDLYDELSAHPYVRPLGLDADAELPRFRGEASTGAHVSSSQFLSPVIPAKAGSQRNAVPPDPGFPPSRE